MPLFDFKCPQCGEIQEQLVLGGEACVCRECGCAELHKLTSMTAPVGRSAGMIARARQRADAQGHFSNYSVSERGRRK
jgi:putative FmdB family regulatory protein